MQDRSKDTVGRSAGAITRWLCVWAFGLVAQGLALAAPAQAEPWAVKRFEVITVRPMAERQRESTGLNGTIVEGAELARRALRDRAGIDIENHQFTEVELDPGVKFKIERFLGETAALFERWGFDPPDLEPIVETQDGERAYRVYLVDGLGTDGRYAPWCDSTREHVILFDARRILENGALGRTSYITLAHELFHAVQFGSHFFSGAAGEYCGNGTSGVGDWIIEGQAEAIGQDVVRLLRQQDIPPARSGSGDTVGKPWGRREYDRTLPVRLGGEKTHAYLTSSFWRYIAEFSATPSPTPDPVTPDYSYLAPFLTAPPSERDCAGTATSCKAEVAWLDEQLQRHIGKNLREVYGKFIPTYSLYGTGRAGQSDETWRTKSFGALGECKVVNLDKARGPVEDVSVPVFEQLSATCFLIRTSGYSGTVNVRARADGAARDLPVADLNAGLAQPPYATKRARVTSGGKTGVWEFPVTANEETGFFLTNVATDTRRTREMNELLVSFTVIEDYAYVKPGSNAQRRSDLDIGPAPGLNLDRIRIKDVVTYPVEINRAKGWRSACILRIRAQNSENGDIVEVSLDSKRPISAGDTFSVLDLHRNKAAPEDHPSMALVGYTTGVVMTTGRFGPLKGRAVSNTTNARTYLGQSGMLEITAFSPDLVSGVLNFFGKQKPVRGFNAPPMVGPESMNVGFEFGFSPRINAGMSSVSREGCWPE
jgi:hypothetical protein